MGFTRLERIQTKEGVRTAQTPKQAQELDYFIDFINPKVEALNTLIDAYHGEMNAIQKVNLLLNIEAEFRDINAKEMGAQQVLCANYASQFHHQLYQEIQDEKEYLGLTPKETAESSPLPNQLSRMPYDKAQALLYQMMQKEKKGEEALPALDCTDAFGPESKAIRLSNKNSPALMLTDDQGRKLFLKADNRLGTPKYADAYLRKHGMSGILLPVLADIPNSLQDARS